MFDGVKYSTSGIATQIPIYLQNILWYMVEIMPEPKDYLQVFELSEAIKDGSSKQKILHTQESPKYLSENIISVKDVITAKVYIIDDCSSCTMLFASEY